MTPDTLFKNLFLDSRETPRFPWFSQKRLSFCSGRAVFSAYKVQKLCSTRNIAEVNALITEAGGAAAAGGGGGSGGGNWQYSWSTFCHD